jgi:UPF0148 protein
MSDGKEGSRNNSHFQDAASLLLRGGCLIGESCPDCSGVQIKFKDNIICVNCGKNRSADNETRTRPDLSDMQELEKEDSQPLSDLLKIEKLITNRIGRLLMDMKSQDDLLIENQRADLIETYLRIIKKIRRINGI